MRESNGDVRDAAGRGRSARILLESGVIIQV